MSAISERIGANVRRLREEQGVTQAALAEEAEVELSYLQKIEYGTANPTLSTLESVARALDADLAALVVAPRTTNPRRRVGRPANR